MKNRENSGKIDENWEKSEKLLEIRYISKNLGKLKKIGRIWEKSIKIGKNREHLVKIEENWEKSGKFGENREIFQFFEKS